MYLISRGTRLFVYTVAGIFRSPEQFGFRRHANEGIPEKRTDHVREHGDYYRLRGVQSHGFDKVHRGTRTARKIHRRRRKSNVSSWLVWFRQ